ncbi:MAG: methyltransferase, TrmH family [Belnapia sp.]|nr:methyltransferase, TrmH family [Belnapia sp.]
MQPESFTAPHPDYQPRPPEPHRICGAAPVRALFLRRPEAVQRLFYTEAMRRIAGPLCAHLARTRRPYREVPAEELARIAGTPHHGGICAIAQVRYAERLPGHALPADLPVAPLLPVLDCIGNPHNLGAIARSAAFFGCRGLLLSDDQRQADLSDAAFRTAEGGLELLRVLRARDLTNLLRGMRGQYLVVAAVAAGGVAPAALPRGRPIALVLGNEEQGPTDAVLDCCEAGVTLTGGGMVESLNVSAAAAVLFHALAGQPAPMHGPRPARTPARTVARPQPAPSAGRLRLPPR